MNKQGSETKRCREEKKPEQRCRFGRMMQDAFLTD